MPIEAMYLEFDLRILQKGLRRRKQSCLDIAVSCTAAECHSSDSHAGGSRSSPVCQWLCQDGNGYASDLSRFARGNHDADAVANARGGAGQEVCKETSHHPHSDYPAENDWLRLEVNDAKIVYTDTEKGLWSWGGVTAGYPEEHVGRFGVIAVYENGDIYAIPPIEDEDLAHNTIYASGNTGLLVGPIPIEQGKIVHKGLAETPQFLTRKQRLAGLQWSASLCFLC